MTPYLVATHVVLMFAGVALAQGPAVLLWGALRREDVPAIRGLLGSMRSSGRFIGPVYMLGVLAGLTAVFVGGFDPLAPWLLIAYALTLVASILPRIIVIPRAQRLAAAAMASPLDAPSAELRAEIAAATTPVFWLDAAVILLLILDMVLKPF